MTTTTSITNTSIVSGANSVIPSTANSDITNTNDSNLAGVPSDFFDKKPSNSSIETKTDSTINFSAVEKEMEDDKTVFVPSILQLPKPSVVEDDIGEDLKLETMKRKREILEPTVADVPVKKVKNVKKTGVLPAGFFDDKEKDEAMKIKPKTDFGTAMEEFDLLMSEAYKERKENIKKDRLELQRMRKQVEDKEKNEQLSKLKELKEKAKQLTQQLKLTTKEQNQNPSLFNGTLDNIVTKENNNKTPKEENSEDFGFLLGIDSDSGLFDDWRSKAL